MAYLIGQNATNWADANWATVCTTAGVSKADGATGATLPTSAGATSDSATFVPAAVALTGVMLNLNRRIGTTGTMSVVLRNSTSGTNVQTVTINTADLPAQTTADTVGAWIRFDFGASHTPNGTDSYLIRCTTSTATMVALNGGASNNWNRHLIVAGTTASAAAGDITYISGIHTTTGAAAACTVTMNNNNTTAFGTCNISDVGALTWSTGGTTNLRLAGNLYIWAGGTNTRSGIAAGTTSKLEFDCGSAVQYGLQIMPGATYTDIGASKTKSWSLLAADAAATATSLTIADSVGAAWKNGDTLVLTSTTRTIGEAETKAMTADGSGTTLTVSAITNAHGGNSTTKVQGEVGNLTRYSKITTVTAANPTYIYIDTTATVDIEWVEIFNIGSNTTNKKGIDILTTTGTCTISHCSIYQGTVPIASTAITISGASSNNYTIDDNVIYNFNGATVGLGIVFGASTSGTNWTISNNLIALITTFGLSLADVGGTTTGNYLSSCSNALRLSESAAIGTINNNICHSNSSDGITFNQTGITGILSGNSSWRNTGSGMIVAFSLPAAISSVQNAYFFGNSTAGITLSQTLTNYVVFDNLTFDAGATLTQPIGIKTGATGSSMGLSIYNCTFGATNGHATGDIDCNGGLPNGMLLYNCNLASTTKISNQSTMPVNSYIQSSRDAQTAGKYTAWYKYGTVQSDTTSLGFSSTVSEKCTPNNASNKLKSASKFVALNSGQTATVGVSTRKGTGYNGNNQRLIVKRNDSTGITSDTTLATATSGVGTVDTISGTTAAVTEDCVLEFYVDLDGTAGFVNTTDWTVSIT